MAGPPAKKARLAQNGDVLPMLSRDEYLSKLETAKKKCAPIGAMYSSLVGGIVTDPVCMNIPIDDHIIVRGHAVFEASTVVNGKLYRLDPHLDRLFRSAKLGRIPLPFGDDEEVNRTKIVNIVAQTVKASGMKNCGVRLYLSVGPGNFDIVPTGCTTALYVVVKADSACWQHELKGAKAATVPCDQVPLKPPMLARTKTNNYLLNALVAMAAEDKGAQKGIGVDANGYITESSIANVGFITTDKRFITPKFDTILAGTTVSKLMQCAKKLVAEGVLKAVSQEDILASEAKKASEAFCAGGDTHIVPLTHWDDKPVGDGKIGEVTKKLINLLAESAESDDNPDDHYILSY